MNCTMNLTRMLLLIVATQLVLASARDLLSMNHQADGTRMLYGSGGQSDAGRVMDASLITCTIAATLFGLMSLVV